MTIYVNCLTVWGLIYTTYYIIPLVSGYTVSKDRPSLQGASAQSLITGPGMSPCSYNCLVMCFSGKSRIFGPQVNDRCGVLCQWEEGGGAKDALPPRYELFLYGKVFLQDVLRRMLVR